MSVKVKVSLSALKLTTVSPLPAWDSAAEVKFKFNGPVPAVIVSAPSPAVTVVATAELPMVMKSLPMLPLTVSALVTVTPLAVPTKLMVSLPPPMSKVLNDCWVTVRISSDAEPLTWLMLNRPSSELVPAARSTVLVPGSEVDGQTGDIVEQGQGVVRGRTREVAAADVFHACERDRVGAVGEADVVDADAEVDRDAGEVVVEGHKVVEGIADDVLDVQRGHARSRRLRSPAYCCRRRGRRRVVVRGEDAVGHVQHVVGSGAVDVLDAEEVDERVGAGRQIQGVVALRQIDRQSR